MENINDKMETGSQEMAAAAMEESQAQASDQAVVEDTAQGAVQATEDAARQQFLTHIQGLEQQGEALRQVFPGFDLRRELRDPLFARLTAPDVGLSVEDAYYTVHRQQLQAAAMELTAQRTAQRITSAIRSGMRPVENGISGQAPSVTACDYRSMSPEQRKELKARIRAGEKIYPGL